MSEQHIKIGDNIRKFRELKNLTREMVAAELNMSLSGYGKIERNEVDLRISRLRQIAQILDVEISWILNFDASRLFHLNPHQFAGEFCPKTANDRQPDDYKDKYIRLLEAENQRLRKEAERL